jgi:hypothetical protein
LLGALSLTHPNGVLVIGLVVLWGVVLVWRQGLPRAALVNLGLTVVVAFAVIAPWTIRNYVVSDQNFVLVAAENGTVLNGVYNSYVLNNPNLRGSWYSPAYAIKNTPARAAAYDRCDAPCEATGQAAETGIAIQWAKAHLTDLPLMMVYRVKKFVTAYTPEADMPLDRFATQPSTQIVRKMAKTMPYLIFLAAALGLVVTLRRYWRELLFAYLVILGTVAEILVLYGNSRFRNPIEPLLLLLGAGALWWLTESQPGTLRWLRSQRPEDSAPKRGSDV